MEDINDTVMQTDTTQPSDSVQSTANTQPTDILLSDYDRIIIDYDNTGSIKETAKHLGISTVKVRKVLITAGLWSSKSSRAIGELYEKGCTVLQIADELFMTVKNVQAYIPYNRGLYGGENRSDSAVWSEEYRERMHMATEKMRRGDGQEYGDSNTSGRERIITKKRTNKEDENMNKSTVKSIVNRTLSKSNTLGGNFHEPQSFEELLQTYRSTPQAMKLHIELTDPWLNEEERFMLKRYGRVQGDTISRDIIVPATMSFHALHYAIQKLFGWRNGHLHHFHLFDKVFNEITEKQFANWVRLCGVLFRFPSDNDEDLYWDDDYKEGISVKSWFRSKYKGPYIYGGLGDYYLSNVEEWQDFYKRFPELEVREGFSMEAIEEAEKRGEKWTRKVLKVTSPSKCTLEEVKDSLVFEEDFNFLLERLSVRDVLTTKPVDITTWKQGLYEILKPLEANLEDGMKRYHQAMQDLEKVWDLRDKFDAKVESGKYNIEDLMECNKETRRLNVFLDALIEEFNPMITPLADSVGYKYDYGDSWKVRISCVETYYDLSEYELAGKKLNMLEAKIANRAGEATSTGETELLLKVIDKEEPVCVSADGLPVLDDVGGMSGYCRFLQEINEGEGKKETKAWGRSLGWTGKMSAAEKML